MACLAESPEVSALATADFLGQEGALGGRGKTCGDTGSGADNSDSGDHADYDLSSSLHRYVSLVGKINVASMSATVLAPADIPR